MAERDAAVEADTATSRALGAVLAIEMNLPGKITARRFDDMVAQVCFTGTGSRDSGLYPLWDQTRIWDPGD